MRHLSTTPGGKLLMSLLTIELINGQINKFFKSSLKYIGISMQSMKTIKKWSSNPFIYFELLCMDWFYSAISEFDILIDTIWWHLITINEILRGLFPAFFISIILFYLLALAGDFMELTFRYCKFCEAVFFSVCSFKVRVTVKLYFFCKEGARLIF